MVSKLGAKKHPREHCLSPLYTQAPRGLGVKWLVLFGIFFLSFHLEIISDFKNFKDRNRT